MFNESNICPFTGLRSFTEDESIYFKGRDTQIDDVTALLERNKFVMVTGASGDGKSSLVYAGLIPNAKAGFFKAKFSNWIIADFRPERTPLKNFSKSISQALDIPDAGTVETELNRGYSALIDLYHSSKYFVDTNSETFKALSADDQRKKRSEGANLMILADQFEELFTNPENYQNKIPSIKAQTTVNILLETAKKALEANIPIYVVCTMRSDYIGQCAAFRGLPEYIGFSQFFVPRLKRNQLVQVIEEPTELSGNRISRRLVERLIYDLSEGVDQLPILQHALNQIWIAADEGTEEMDLIHYAMVGGMHPSELPDEDSTKFGQWFNSQPEYIKIYYADPGLNNVLDIHANKLYELAASRYNERYQDNLSVRNTKRIIAMTFSCLTKIDQERAVRNRMSLREITNIINQEDISIEVVNRVLQLFREQGNTFIKPFILEGDNREIAPDTVLDITHESLIRNWKKLRKWAEKEYEFYETFLDLDKQRKRWEENDRSKSYLLPVGPLSYFERWYEECKPNEYWISRYRDQNDPDRESESRKTLHSIRDFISLSIKKHRVARAFMKYGPKRIAAVFSLLFIITLSSFYYIDANSKRNGQIIRDVTRNSYQLIQSPEIPALQKGMLILTHERHTKGSMMQMLSSIDDPQQKLNSSIAVYNTMLILDGSYNGELKYELLTQISETVSQLIGTTDISQQRQVLRSINRLLASVSYDNTFKPDTRLEIVSKNHALDAYKLIIEYLDQPDQYDRIWAGDIDLAVYNILNYGNLDTEALNQMVRLLCPFEGPNAFDFHYPRDIYKPNGFSTINYNGGYNTSGALYAATGSLDKLSRCVDTLARYTPEYTDMVPHFDNYTQIGAYLIKGGYLEEFNSFNQHVAESFNADLTDIYWNYVDRMYTPEIFFISNTFDFGFTTPFGTYNPAVEQLTDAESSLLTDQFMAYLASLENPDQRNYEAALLQKTIALLKDARDYNRQTTAFRNEIREHISLSLDFYNKVSIRYLNENISFLYRYYGEGVRRSQLSRDELYLYPDNLKLFHAGKYNSDVFMAHLMNQGSLRNFYQTDDEIDLLANWIANYKEEFAIVEEEFAQFNRKPIDEQILLTIKGILETDNGEVNHLNLTLANQYFNDGSDEKARAIYRGIDLERLPVTLAKWEYLNATYIYNQVAELAKNFALKGEYDRSSELIEKVESVPLRAASYLILTEYLYNADDIAGSFTFLDSALSLSRKINITNLEFNERVYINLLVHNLSMIGGEDLMEKGWDMVVQVNQNRKWGTIVEYVRGILENGNYYQATSATPANPPEQFNSILNTSLIYADIEKGESTNPLWRSQDHYFDRYYHYLFYVTN